ncbi:MAG: hypothetical protein J6S41_00495, partial [Clostridia bacterium]|nr:hypothetical protein [Clostridia bacterium]
QTNGILTMFQMVSAVSKDGGEYAYLFNHTLPEGKVEGRLKLTADEAVARCAAVLGVFEQSGVQVIRIGLCASENLTDPACAVAGANHPALGELVRSERYYQKLRVLLSGARAPVQTVYIPARELSVAIGQHRQNLLRLQEEFGAQLRLVAADCRTPQLYEKETEHCT